jgi:integrase
MDGPHSGAPYKLGCFKKAYARAISRIGLSPSKRNGTTPHGHRHAYGYRLEEVGIIPQTIKNCMHHHSISSQLVYTRPEVEKMNAELTDAEARLAAGIRLSPQQIMEKISREFEQFVQLS